MPFTNPVHVYRDFEDRHWWYVARRRIMAPLVAAVVPPGQDAQLVDVGCGGGANIASFVGEYRCVGIDISEDLVRAGRARFPEVTFIRGEAPGNLGDIAHTADAFLLMDVIEHIEGDRQYFERLFRAARQGAVFFLTVPANPDLWSPHDDAVGHQRRYVPSTLRALWAGLPAEELLLEHFNHHLYPLIRATRALSKQAGRGSGDAGTDFAMPPRPANWVLAAIMGAERGRILARLKGSRKAGYRGGVSLLAIVRKA